MPNWRASEVLKADSEAGPTAAKTQRASAGPVSAATSTPASRSKGKGKGKAKKASRAKATVEERLTAIENQSDVTAKLALSTHALCR